MTTMRDILNARQKQKFATDAGIAMHKRLENMDTNDDIIKSHPELLPFFASNAKTEVPIAGIINGKFISRRIDRLVPLRAAQGVAAGGIQVLPGDQARPADGVVENKEILFMDYKTDINKSTRYDDYIAQIREYSALLHAVYPNCAIRGFILWTNDFTLEEIK